MRRFSAPLIFTLLVACASPGRPSAAQLPPLPLTSGPVPAAVPENWQNMDLNLDGVPGTSTERALHELLANRKPARTVLVAVIDGGVDTTHADLRDALWHNPKETPGNGKDDDGDGYVDDVYGWNFLGGPDGRSVDRETLELTRLYAQCEKGATPDGYDCATITLDFTAERANADSTAKQVAQIESAFDAVTTLLQQATGLQKLTPEAVRALASSDPRTQQARGLYLQFSENGLTPDYLKSVEEQAANQAKYDLNPSFDPRGIVGDDVTNGAERNYGNRDVMGPDAMHGTHVAGIIGAARNGLGNDGIAAPNVRIMMVRAVPNGDERDKDIANAIRFAVDHGAQIINMSFGKAFSPQKPLVDAAVSYADQHGVLMIHAAGNDGADLDADQDYPEPAYVKGGRAANWITVGASSWKVDSLAAEFSNYGRTQVDLFAPGVAILSTVPGGGWARLQGTSMAAPVVTGVAALLMAYFPNLTAAEVKRILIASAVKYGDPSVALPGGPAPPVKFGTLSVAGGVVNTYEAVRMALSASSAGE